MCAAAPFRLSTRGRACVNCETAVTAWRLQEKDYFGVIGHNSSTHGSSAGRDLRELVVRLLDHRHRFFHARARSNCSGDLARIICGHAYRMRGSMDKDACTAARIHLLPGVGQLDIARDVERRTVLANHLRQQDAGSSQCDRRSDDCQMLPARRTTNHDQPYREWRARRCARNEIAGGSSVRSAIIICTGMRLLRWANKVRRRTALRLRNCR